MANRDSSKTPGHKVSSRPRTPSRERKREGEPGSDHRNSALRVVGIGGSAGGVDALIELLSGVPSDTGLAFVIIQHLDPHHDSQLAGVLARATTLPVQQVTDGLRIERDHIYVIPPDTELTMSGNLLHLVPRTAKAPHRPLDAFFWSLAEERESGAIGVVLSGNDADGALGLRAIQNGGGITFAQSPQSARFDAMPRAAAEAADFVLPPAEIAERLVKIAEHARGEAGGDPSESGSVEPFDRVLRLLHEHRAVDFGHFKRSSLERRIMRRVFLGSFDGLDSYADSLETDAAAIEILYQDFLIGVTSFFREPARFEALKTVVLPAILQKRTPEDTVRIWVAGCSTGEEVFSLAMTLLEFLDDHPTAPRITIYGTDINQQSLRKARVAFYSERAVGGVSPERLERFFAPAPGGFKIAKALRELCVFAAHDVTRDPPYSRIDLITCCNVLIYFDTELQKKAVAALQYSLAPGGFLMLGSSESLRASTSQLTSVSAKPLIYQKKAGTQANTNLDIHSPSSQSRATASPLRLFAARPAGSEDDTFLAARFAPCAVLINAQLEITRIRGQVAPFIALDQGDVSLGLFGLVRSDEILAVLRPAVRRAFEEKVTVTQEDILIVDGEHRSLVAFEVIPHVAPEPGHDRCWIVFHSVPAPAASTTQVSRQRSETESLRQALAAAIEDREQLADEASAAAEEAQSSDEELRSTNEELETSKEELQSANEELNTLNDELRIRNTALGIMNDDIENLLGAVEIPILFVGIDLRVRRFNATAGLLLNLRHESTGRSLRELESTLDVSLMEKLAGAVVETGAPADVEVQDASGDWRLLRIRAYRTYDGKIDGAIVAVLDINILKRSVVVAEEATRAATMLSHASAVLASSLDYETTLGSLARFATTSFADWCAVDLIDEDGSVRHLTVSHTNPVMRDLALQFQQAAFSDPERAPGAPQALRQRKSVLLTDIAEAMRTGVPPLAKITQLTDALGVRSLISVPLIVRERVLGTTTFSSSRRPYDAADLQLAEELSQRAAIAIDTALLFREAESANRYKDAFLGTVAHELRTPLTSIIGWLQLAKDHPDMYGEAIDRVAEAANLLRIFTEDLLDVTRIREQKLNMEMKDVDLAPIVKSAIEVTALSANAGGKTVHLQLMLEPAPLRGDAVRLLQVVWNLLSNAIKFTPANGTIDVRLERAVDQACLTVADNGAGISPGFLPHVFELYRQAEETASPMRGLGIGLSIVSQIVKLHGGTARAESLGLGQGATFTVLLPLAAGEGKHFTIAEVSGTPAGETS